MLALALAAGALAVAALTFARPGLLGRVPPVVGLVAAGTGALVVAVAGTAPTGWSGLDLVLRAGFGAGVALAATRAGLLATAWLALVATATLVVADAPLAGAAAVSLGAVLSLLASGDASRPSAEGAPNPAAGALAAVAAVAAIGPLAHADWPVATGASAVAVALASLPVLLIGAARAPRRPRSWIATGVAVAVIVLVGGSVAGGVAALGASSDVDDAVRAATRGLELLGDDDERARVRLTEAAESFEAAQATLGSWWARPALLVPGVAQQARAVTTMAGAGADLARTAVAASADADVDSVRPRDGRVDLAALAALVEPLDRSLASLRRAAERLDGVRSPLLLTPVAERLDDLRAEVGDALGSAELAADAVAIAPELLGASGPRRYFVAFQNPAELRGSGGFMGSWGEVVTDGGRFRLERTGRFRELSPRVEVPRPPTVDIDPEFVDRYGPRAALSWGLVSFSPDFPTVADVMAQLYPQSGGAPVDGVIGVTPAAFAAFLELTGPIDVPGYPDRLTADTAERILLHEQYLAFPREAVADDDDREQFLADAAEVLFDELTSGDLPGPRGIAAEVGPAVAGRHLQLWAARPGEQALFERMGADGSIRRVASDSFGVTGQNFGGNKIDWFLRRTVTYELTWDPGTGEVEGTLEVELTNEAPDEGLPGSIIGWGGDEVLGQTPVAQGENLMMVSLYNALGLSDVTVDGEPLGQTGAGPEVGHQATSAFVAVPSGATRTVRAVVSGTVEPGSRYRIVPVRQPTVVPDGFVVRLHLAPGWEVTGSAGAGTVGSDRVEATWTAAEPRLLEVDVARSGDDRTLLDRLRGR